mmetsp:Transcript_19201/g.67774  ORF Transcript_19201/g.67774 Transcript_19201/m.67774 type:complete len:322 (+) Transcript_19201:1161-2126(+)
MTERGRRCCISRSVSSLWNFFDNGYVLASAVPSTVALVACSSISWPLAGDAMMLPVMRSEEPTVPFSNTSAKPSVLSTLHTTCKQSKQEPSESDTNTSVSFACLRVVRDQPATVTLWPTAAKPLSGRSRRSDSRTRPRENNAGMAGMRIVPSAPKPKPLAAPASPAPPPPPAPPPLPPAPPAAPPAPPRAGADAAASLPPPPPLNNVTSPSTPANAGWCTQVRNHRVRLGRLASRSAAPMAVANKSRSVHATATSASVTRSPTRNVRVARCASSTANTGLSAAVAAGVALATSSSPTSSGMPVCVRIACSGSISTAEKSSH